MSCDEEKSKHIKVVFILKSLWLEICDSIIKVRWHEPGLWHTGLLIRLCSEANRRRFVRNMVSLSQWRRSSLAHRYSSHRDHHLHQRRSKGSNAQRRCTGLPAKSYMKQREASVTHNPPAWSHRIMVFPVWKEPRILVALRQDNKHLSLNCCQ